MYIDKGPSITQPFCNLELHCDELGHIGHTNIFTFPLLTEKFCNNLIKKAEDANLWKTDRHGSYPTTDVLLKDLDSGMYANYNQDALCRYVYPLANKVFDNEKMVEFEPGRMVEETFIARYDTSQTDLDMHHDDSVYTCIVQLNSNFEGGGTYFKNQKILVKNKTGHATIHPGPLTHKHGARMTTQGRRYVLVSFIKTVPYDNKPIPNPLQRKI